MGICFSNDDNELATISGPSNNNNMKKPLKADEEARRRRAQKRKNAVTEILETEHTYVKRMQMCITYFFDPLLDQKKLISKADHQTLFSDYKIILSLNVQFEQDLESAVSNDNIGEQFLQFCPYFRMYQNYLNNYDRSMEILPRLQSKQAFSFFCNEQRQQCNGQQLQSFLILPIQRLPRYKMCLQEIVKNTEPEHRDLSDLKNALEMVAETTTLINNRMKEFEARQQVRAIERRFNQKRMSLVKPSRTFVKEGQLIKVAKTAKEHMYTFLLFNDVLLYAAGNADSLKMHGELPIDHAFYIQDVRNHEKYGNCAFEIHSSVKSFVVYANNNEMKRTWMKAIQSVVTARVKLQVGKTQQRELAAPLMIPDGWTNKCMMKECGKPFTTFNRRHHCRFCGKLVCGKCSNYKLGSKVHKNKVVKPVCIICYNTWSKIYAPVKGATEEEDYESDEEDDDDDDRKADH